MYIFFKSLCAIDINGSPRLCAAQLTENSIQLILRHRQLLVTSLFTALSQPILFFKPSYSQDRWIASLFANLVFGISLVAVVVSSSPN